MTFYSILHYVGPALSLMVGFLFARHLHLRLRGSDIQNFEQQQAQQAKIINLRHWFLTIIEDAESLEEAKNWARRALDKETCPEDIREGSV